jgi:hypothetical protein
MLDHVQREAPLAPLMKWRQHRQGEHAPTRQEQSCAFAQRSATKVRSTPKADKTDEENQQEGEQRHDQPRIEGPTGRIACLAAVGEGRRGESDKKKDSSLHP